MAIKKKSRAAKSAQKAQVKKYLASKGYRLPHGYEVVVRKKKISKKI